MRHASSTSSPSLDFILISHIAFLKAVATTPVQNFFYGNQCRINTDISYPENILCCSHLPFATVIINEVHYFSFSLYHYGSLNVTPSKTEKIDANFSHDQCVIFGLKPALRLKNAHFLACRRVQTSRASFEYDSEPISSTFYLFGASLRRCMPMQPHAKDMTFPVYRQSQVISNKGHTLTLTFGSQNLI